MLGMASYNTLHDFKIIEDSNMLFDSCSDWIGKFAPWLYPKEQQLTLFTLTIKLYYISFTYYIRVYYILTRTYFSSSHKFYPAKSDLKLLPKIGCFYLIKKVVSVFYLSWVWIIIIIMRQKLKRYTISSNWRF